MHFYNGLEGVKGLNLIRIRHCPLKGYVKPEISYYTIFHPVPPLVKSVQKRQTQYSLAKLGDADGVGDVEGAS